MVPEALLGTRQLRLTHDGEDVVHRFGDLTVELALDEPESVHFGRSRELALLPFFAGTLLVAAGVVAACSWLVPPASEQLSVEEQVILLKQYLSATVEVEQPPEPVPLEAGQGVPNGSKHRFAIQGPKEIERQAALMDAAEFGMIGLLSSGGSGGPSAPFASGNTQELPTQAGDPSADGLEPQGGEEYSEHGVNPVVDAAKDPLSTFSIDVDTAAYSLARRKLESSTRPPLISVRAEEFINAFDYGYPGPEQTASSDAFAVHLDAAPSPFDRGHHLLRVAIQGRRVEAPERPRVHLVYLVDTSGSRAPDDRLPLAKQSLRLLTSTLRPDDTIALCTYAGEVREVLPPTPAAASRKILNAIDQLNADGSTAMGSGIELAYRLAERTHVRGEISRVVVLSDGDANVGETHADAILKTIERQRARGITLSTVGFGVGNYKDARMERLANAGDGNYSYIGDESDARRVFVEHVNGLVQVIARDVKLQVVFDPGVVRRYRLIGYENREIADGDFRNDRVDAGEIGAGHAVTALYDVELHHVHASPLTLHIRHKPALEGDWASEIAVAMPPENIRWRFEDADPSFRFATAVAGFAEVLRGSPYALDWKLEQVRSIARGADQEMSERVELVSLVERAIELRDSDAFAAMY